MQYYEKNMEILKKRFKSVYDKIKKAEENKLFILKQCDKNDLIAEIVDQENDFTIYIEKARRGGYTMKIKKEEKEIYFHSKYAPEREAKKIVKDFGFSSKKQNFILGIGLGYYLKQFNNKNKYDKIIVIEPFLSIFYAALFYNDLSKFLNQNNLALILADDNNLFDIIRAYIKINLEKDIDFLEHSPSLNLFGDEYKEIYKKIREGINYEQVGLVSNIKQTKKWRNNIIYNIPYIINNPKADDFFEEFKNVPAICVSAGPSLDIDIEEIKKAKGKAIIMCVGTALKALLKHNIEPDIVVSMDGNMANYKHFENLETPDSYLLTELGNHYMINKDWNNKQIFFTMKRNFSGWIEKIKGDYAVIQTGGTVAHSMVDLAYKFGADPIVLVGQDLAYKDKKTHASGTTYENDKVTNKKLYEVESFDGGTVLTDKSFKTMLSFFNNYFTKKSKRLFIDATEGGAKIEGTIVKRLDETIEKYCDSEIDVREKLENLYAGFKSDMDYENKLKNQLDTTIRELKESIQITEEQMKAMDKVKDKLHEKNKISRKELKSLEHFFSKYEKDLNQTNYLSYFLERVLISESMKLDKATSKYYINERKSLEERLGAYYDFRNKFLIELKESLDLLESLYLSKENKITLDKENMVTEREVLT